LNIHAVSHAPDLSALEIPKDAWTQPFWDATAAGKLLLPRCSLCARFRWPPGPFCPHCQSQLTDWVDPGVARIYSFTIISDENAHGVHETPQRAAALVEFPAADRIRILAALVATPLAAIRIGAQLKVSWSPAVNGIVPVFSIPS
jgi:uncharacterized protein